MINTSVNEVQLIEQKDLREQMIEKIEVLDKVKKLFLIPDMEVMTTKMVADYYEVDSEAIQKVYQRNKEEINSDGTKNIKNVSEFLLGHSVQPTIVQMNGCKEVIYKNIKIVIPNSNIKVFSKRSILCIGMLLRDSRVAQEVRTQLLNVFENSSPDQRITDINEELEIFAEIGRANATGTKEDVQVANRKYLDYKSRYIIQLENTNTELSTINKELETTNQILTNGIMTWGDREILNALIRALAVNCFHRNFAAAWNSLYRVIRYKLGINVRGRSGNKNLIDRIQPEEMKDVISVAASLCEENNLSVGKIVNAINLDNINTYRK